MMRYKGYLGKVDVDGDEFYGTVVNLHRDHVDFRGKTIDEVQQAFRESIDFYLEGCRKDGEEPEKPFSGRFVVRLSPTHPPSGKYPRPTERPEPERGRGRSDRRVFGGAGFVVGRAGQRSVTRPIPRVPS